MSVGLSMIFLDEIAQVKDVVDSNRAIFDAFYLTNAAPTKENFELAERIFDDYEDVHLSYFKMPKPLDFAAARNHNLSQIKTDFWVWQDTDDFVHYAKIPELVQRMEDEKLDAIYFPYDYAQDDLGNCIAMHWRERLIRTSHPFSWKGKVHETLISERNPEIARNDEIEWIHDNPPEKATSSLKRNLEILEAEYKNGDPRTTHYLGITLFADKQYERAIEYLREHIEKSGWKEESYRSQLKIAQSYAELGDLNQALNESLFAARMMPDYPDAYLLLAQYEFEMDNPKACLEWLKVANQKQIPETLSIVDPTTYGFRAVMLGAMANLMLGRFDTAYELLQEVLRQQPEYELAREQLPLFRKEYEKKLITDAIKVVSLGLKDDKKALKALYEALPEEFKYDARVAPLRNMVKEPEKWSDKSIVFFCGTTFEHWGPDLAENGMGGSEEAVMYLSRELDKLGWDVTVFNTRDKMYKDGNITYLPWYHIDYRDEFNVLVAWRAPEIARGLKAKLKILDVHDVLTPERMATNQQHYDQIHVKTNYHKSLYPGTDEDKFVVIGNGLLKSQFKRKRKKPFSAGYFSAPDRGLLTLLKLWPEIHKEVPKATLVWNYGWESYVNAMGKDALYHQVKSLFEELKDQGVTEGGRISHEELAEVMAETKVWLYPTEFPEIHCITALKAEESGMYPVTTKVAALKETVTQGTRLPTEHIYTDPDMQQKFIKEAVKALKTAKPTKPQVGVDWKDVAKKWEEAINNGLGQKD